MKKIAVVTGGAGGMGLATAKLLGRDHHVVVCDLQPERLSEAISSLKQMGISCDSIVCDIADRASVDRLVDFACALGAVVAVVHTAGISPQMADPKTILRVNALGTLNIVEAFYAVADEDFALVNVASTAAHLLPRFLVPVRAFTSARLNPELFLKKAASRTNLVPSDFYRKGMAYAISKCFVIWYSKASAVRFGAKGARVLSVSPGTFNTEMGRLEEKSGSMEMLKHAALKRAGRPEEIAEVLAFCASKKAGYVTGVDILCDGGVMAGKMFPD